MEEKKDKTIVGYFLPEKEPERSKCNQSILDALVNVMSIPSRQPHRLLLYSRKRQEAIEDILDILRKGQFPAPLKSGHVPMLCHDIIDLVYRAEMNCSNQIEDYQDLHNLMYFALREWIEWSRANDKK